MTIEQMLENNLKEFLMLIIALIVLFFVLPKILVLIIKISSKIYEKFFMGDNIIKISNYKGDVSKPQVIGRKTIIRDADGRIISEETEGIDEELFDKITEQTMKGECISDDGTVVNKKGVKIADFGSRENFEESKRNHNNVWEELPGSVHRTVKTYVGQVPEEFKEQLERYGSVSMKKDQYEVVVKDKNGNILEGKEKEEAIKLMKKIASHNEANMQQTNMTTQQFSDMIKSKGFADAEELKKLQSAEDIKREIRGEAEKIMNSTQAEKYDVIDEIEIDDAGITKY